MEGRVADVGAVSYFTKLHRRAAAHHSQGRMDTFPRGHLDKPLWMARGAPPLATAYFLLLFVSCQARAPLVPFDPFLTAACPNDCSEHGVCFGGRCICEEPYVGADCSLRARPRPRLFLIPSSFLPSGCNTLVTITTRLCRRR